MFVGCKVNPKNHLQTIVFDIIAVFFGFYEKF